MSVDICISVKNKNQRSGNTVSKVQTVAAVDTFSLFLPLICLVPCKKPSFTMQYPAFSINHVKKTNLFFY